MAALDDDALRARLATRCIARDSDTSAVVSAVRDLDGHTVKRLLEAHLAELGPAAFATDFAMPLARTVGDAWRRGELSIAAEHLLTSVLRSILAGAMEGDGSTEARLGPRIVFATPSGEPHDLGLMAAAVVAAHAGAVPIVLGADLPVDEVVETARRTGAGPSRGRRGHARTRSGQAWLGALRAALPSGVQLWVGGAGARLLLPRRGATVVGDLSGLARAVAEIH
ncbi:MAG: B12-binding domain-containing protein [Myxococcota bacterium]